MSSPRPWRRSTARVLPVDAEGRVLPLHGWDPHHPEIPGLIRAAAASVRREQASEQPRE